MSRLFGVAEKSLFGKFGKTTFSTSNKFKKFNLFNRNCSAAKQGGGGGFGSLLFGVVLGVGGVVAYYETRPGGMLNIEGGGDKKASSKAVNFDDVKKDIAKIMAKDDNLGPTFVRLAWHASGTYSKVDGTGGSDGGRIRFNPEANWGANAGLGTVRTLLEDVKKKYPGISYADLYTLAGVAAVEEMGGPKIPWKPGRKDATDGATSPADGRLPGADKGSKDATIGHVRDIFYRMGFNDQEIVALIGAHALGRCHPDRSGYDGPWTKSPTVFSNWFFKELLDNKWTVRKWNGPMQYQDAEGGLMMLPADMAFIWDPKFKVYVEKYAKDEQLFFNDFAKAFGKLLELGVKFDK